MLYSDNLKAIQVYKRLKKAAIPTLYFFKKEKTMSCNLNNIWFPTFFNDLKNTNLWGLKLPESKKCPPLNGLSYNNREKKM